MGSIGFFLLMTVIGSGIIYRGMSAIKTERFRGKWGRVYQGQTAIWLGRLCLLIGPFLIIGSAARAIIDLT